MSAPKQRPRKRFGQNFLVDQGVARRIAQACALARGDRVVEIGPGRGALTVHLLDCVDALDAVEIDRDLVAELRARWPERLHVHEGDALRFDFGPLLAGGDRTVVGNLPYNISTPLLLRLLAHVGSIRQMVFMLQQEVVDRLCAEPGNKNYGRLTVMVGYACEATPVLDVAPGAFYPVPKVRSRVVRLVPRVVAPMPAAMPGLVRQAFGQRRKTLRNALSGWVAPEQFAALDIDPGRRPETLSIADFVRLSACVRADDAARVRAAGAPRVRDWPEDADEA